MELQHNGADLIQTCYKSYRVEVYYECVPDLEEPEIMATKNRSFIVRKSQEHSLEPLGISRAHVGRVETTCLVLGFPVYGSYLNDWSHPENGKQRV